RVNTGNVVRAKYDSVIKVEDAAFDGSDSPREITIRAPAAPGVNVRPVGEDILEGKLILPAGAKIRAFDVGAIAGYGITEVYVTSVSVGIIPTGTELIEPGFIPKPGQVVESNTMMAESYLHQFGV
ncbi:MAG: molybdopterin biosynthesis protein, partial [Methanocorpusculum sp.]|nr:molybdopterin biosynthesis protein [Methanocorpusculum sp.]